MEQWEVCLAPEYAERKLRAEKKLLTDPKTRVTPRNRIKGPSVEDEKDVRSAFSNDTHVK